MAIANKLSWQSAQLVSEYGGRSGLQRPEQVVRDRLGDRLASMRMLDIGVGCGRTTPHFADCVREYVGIDYSEPMIVACRRRWSGSRARFEVADATDMQQFPAASFDFVLFSFNGIDYVSHDERLRILAEVRRVSRAGAMFCFSSHNLLAIDRVNRLRDQWGRSPINTGRRLVEWAGWVWRHQRRLDRRALREADHAVFNDGAYHGALETYYVRPAAQLRQLTEAGFDDVRVLALDDGRELDAAELPGARDPWLTYCCQVPGSAV